jgi:hypothetical protein
MEFIRKEILLNKLIIIDGIGRSGKSLLSDIIGSFDAVEKQDYNPFLEYIALAYKYNKISADMAISILQTEMDSALYKNMVGRQVNTRLTDGTSLYRYHSPEKYLRRMIDGEGPMIHGKVLKEKPIYLNWSHDLINKSDIVFEAYGKHLEFVYLNRRPVDMIYEWDDVSYSERMSKDPTEMQYCIKYKDMAVPEVALGWEEEYLSCKPIERAVKMIYTYFKLNHTALMAKQSYQNLHIISFEDLLTNPNKEIERLKVITGNQPLPAMKKILDQANCPRAIDEEAFLEREAAIKSRVADSYLLLLQEMDGMYAEIKLLSVKRNTVMERV